MFSFQIFYHRLAVNLTDAEQEEIMFWFLLYDLMAFFYDAPVPHSL